MRASALVLLAFALAGCGCSGRGCGPLPSTGETLFVQRCGSCHTLSDAGTKSTVGTNLDEAKPTKTQVLAAIERGPGAMPAGIVTGTDAEAVAAFVAHAAGR